MVGRGLVAALFMLLTLGTSADGRADDRNEAVVTVQVSAAEHEAQEGYFSLGDDTTVMVKPGTDLHQFLNSRRGKKITIRITDGGQQLSRLDR
jgi:hypothetical protein